MVYNLSHLWLLLHLWLIITLMGDTFMVNYNICVFNPLSLSPYPLLQWRLGNSFIGDSILLTLVMLQRLLGESTVLYVFYKGPQ